MSKKIAKILFAALLATFISGSVLTSTMQPVAAGSVAHEERPTSPSDTPKDGNNEHSGHH